MAAQSTITCFRTFWGKARPNRPGPSFHPAWAHGLDVAACGAALVRARPGAFATIAHQLGCSCNDLEAVWLHLLALHDIGKFSPLFQGKVPDLYPADAIPRPDAAALKVHDPGHPLAGYLLLRAWLADEAAPGPMPPLFEEWSWGAMARLLDPVLGHHGRPVVPSDDDWRHLYRPAASAQAAFAYWQAAALLLPPPKLRQPKPSQLVAGSWGLAGLTALADWIGSNQAWFPYVESGADIDGYWDAARKLAEEAVREAGLAPAAPGLLRSFADLTGIAHPPTNAQGWAATADLPDGPLLVLVEDVTGGGKTEAALMLAHRLLAGGRAAGIYFALPTMATANAMFDRIEAIAPHLYAEAASPSLTLAHGRASLHPRFRPTLARLGRTAADAGGPEADSAVAAPAWLAAESRKALLADLGVGTVDQALLAVLPVRHQAVRLAGLAGKVLIIDEAHSYDAYVGTELDRLVTFHGSQGGSTIILSATLPSAVKARLVAAWRRAVGSGGAAPRAQAYPGATLVAASCDPVEMPLAARADLCRTLTVTRVRDQSAALDRIGAAARADACVAWVRNTVDDAVEGAAALREAGIDADVFHARFAMGDRLAIERRVLNRFGKASTVAERRGRVLVATQVVEQSLDLDFDLVVSDLAPIDLLLQRAGRLWRHTSRARPIFGPELVVVSPDPAGPIAADWANAAFPRASYVYADHAVLWRTAREIAAHPAFRVPEEVRAAIEAVYAESQDDVPEPLHRRRNEATGKAAAERAFAEANLLDPASGYSADGQAWQSEAKVSTRLAEESRTLRLAKPSGGRLVPWHDDSDASVAWALSEVTAYERKLRGRYRPGPRLSALADAARTGPAWGRFEDDTILLPLEERTDGVWAGVLVDEGGAELAVAYHSKLGLRLP